MVTSRPCPYTEFFVISVFPHGKNREPLGELTCNFTLENFSKVFGENSSSLKIWQTYRTLYIKLYMHVFIILVSSIYMRNVSSKLCTENQAEYSVFNYFSDNPAFHEGMKKSTVWENKDKNNRAHALWLIDTKDYKHSIKICTTDFRQQQRLRERTSMVCYMYIVCLLVVLIEIWATSHINSWPNSLRTTTCSREPDSNLWIS
jgi:hypothetical protein